MKFWNCDRQTPFLQQKLTWFFFYDNHRLEQGKKLLLIGLNYDGNVV